MMNKNIKETTARDINRAFGVKQSNSIGNYLGLLAQTGRNKGIMFSGLKERVWKILQNWKGKLMSTGVKEILIKAIAQAVSIYTMSCFRLPNSICDEINKA